MGSPLGVGAAALAVAVGALGGVAPDAASDEVTAQGKRPNVVVIMTDDQEARSLGVLRKTKRLLGRRGTTFTNSFATFPLCCPSRATFLTGQYAHNHGVERNRLPEGGFERFDDRGSLPMSMHRAGYRTGFVGKYLNGYGSVARKDPDTIPRGWNQWFGLMGSGYFDYRLNENGRIKRYGSKRRAYQTDVFARKATGFIRRSSHRRKPFFLTVAPYAPHGEPGRRGAGGPNPRPAPRHRGAFRGARLPKPPSFNERDVSDKPSFVQRRSRLNRKARRSLAKQYRDRMGTLLAVDDAVKSVVGELRRTNELRRTFIIFTSDNGWLNGEHRIRGKINLYEESAKVPLIIRGPGIPRGERRTQITGNIDLAPTIIDVGRADALRVMDGRSLVPLARSPSKARGRDLLLENLYFGSAAVRTPDWMYAEHERSERELYDLGADPFQLDSLHVGGPPFKAQPAGRQANLRVVQAQLADRLRELENCRGSSCR